MSSMEIHKAQVNSDKHSMSAISRYAHYFPTPAFFFVFSAWFNQLIRSNVGDDITLFFLCLIMTIIITFEFFSQVILIRLDQSLNLGVQQVHRMIK